MHMNTCLFISYQPTCQHECALTSRHANMHTCKHAHQHARAHRHIHTYMHLHTLARPHAHPQSSFDGITFVWGLPFIFLLYCKKFWMISCSRILHAMAFKVTCWAFKFANITRQCGKCTEGARDTVLHVLRKRKRANSQRHMFRSRRGAARIEDTRSCTCQGPGEGQQERVSKREPGEDQKYQLERRAARSTTPYLTCLLPISYL